MMAKFTSSPETVDAFQWDGTKEGAEQIQRAASDWITVNCPLSGDVLLYYTPPGDKPSDVIKADEWVVIDRTGAASIVEDEAFDYLYEHVLDCGIAKPEAAETAKPKRKRRAKAEMEAARCSGSPVADVTKDDTDALMAVHDAILSTPASPDSDYQDQVALDETVVAS
jgi:hypothetical protein